MFIPLRIHSVYSKGKGGASLPELAAWAHRESLSSAALTDIQNLYGWGEWKRAALEEGVRPLFGCEVKLEGRRYLFVVKNKTGYRNLMEILNHKQVKEAQGLVTVLIPHPREEEPGDELFSFAGEDFYLGATFFNIQKVTSWTEKYNLPAVWANPLKYIRNPQRLILLHAIQEKIPFPPEKERQKERVKLMGPIQERIALQKWGASVKKFFRRTFEIAEKCRFAFEEIVPPLPENLFPTTLREMMMEKLREKKNLTWKERQRAKKELEAVEESGFAPYFLVVHDVVQFARRQGIIHNLRGSGASSYLAYLLGISWVNPLRFDLYFERFLNPGRKDPPDFDLDFDSRRRDEVLSYVLQKYSQGKSGAAFVCSLKNFRARSALYETARAFGFSPQESRSLSQKIPPSVEPHYLKKHTPPSGCAEVWKAASDLTSVYSENSLHVGGVILTPSPSSRYLPLEKSKKGYLMSHFDRNTVEELKLIKLDLLSVRGLAAVSETKTQLGIRNIPPGDPKTYALLKRSHTIGCFQVESPAMMNLLRRMRPENIFHLTQALALIRPGPTESGMKEALLRSREGKPVSRDSVMIRILPETRGLLLYEEQVMQIAERVAGLSPSEGEHLRRSLKKKKREFPLKEHFFKEARERGYTQGELQRMWKVMEKFSSYSFNKAHSASYAHMAYQGAYLKAHHPLHYLTAVLNAGGGYYGLGEYVEEAKRRGIRVLGPDVNQSSLLFTAERKHIRVGLGLIKGLEGKAIQKIMEEREKGPYESLEDFLSRVPLTRAELFILLKAGVFDSLEPKRTRQILRYYQGIDGIDPVSDLEEKEKEKMLVESLGFDPVGDSLSLWDSRRPSLRIKDVGNHAGREVELMVRVVDARLKKIKKGHRYFFLFEDETGLLEGVGEKECLSFASPPFCYLRGKVRKDGQGQAKIVDCSFIHPEFLPSP